MKCALFDQLKLGSNLKLIDLFKRPRPVSNVFIQSLESFFLWAIVSPLASRARIHVFQIFGTLQLEELNLLWRLHVTGWLLSLTESPPLTSRDYLAMATMNLYELPGTQRNPSFSAVAKARFRTCLSISGALLPVGVIISGWLSGPPEDDQTWSLEALGWSISKFSMTFLMNTHDLK